MLIQVTKAILTTILAAAFFLGLYHMIGYERTELLAFAVLIGLSCASLKSS